MIKPTMSCLLFLMLVQPVYSASFDCAKAGTKVEKMICAEPELSKLNEDMSAAYRKALEESANSFLLMDQQDNWLKDLNKCLDVQCVKQAYEQRLPDISGNSRHYHFTLTKGEDTPVCDAYLKRLNETEFTSPPYCGRPENDSVEGFSKLKRKLLSPYDVHDLYPIISKFMSSANSERVDWASEEPQNQLVEKGQFRMTKEGLKVLQNSIDAGWSKFWGYNPYVDINNDGLLDNVLIWHGNDMSHGGVIGKQCGEYSIKFNMTLRLAQTAFVVSSNGSRLDVVKTRKVFSHPSGGYNYYSRNRNKWVVSKDFRSVGKSMGIFKYRGLYYFDTFFDEWGDFEDKRRITGVGEEDRKEARSRNKNIVNTLGVFLHQDGQTKQVCEYLMKVY